MIDEFIIKDIDKEIRDLVILFNDNNFQTFTSCVGGKGHCFPLTTIGFETIGNFEEHLEKINNIFLFINSKSDIIKKSLGSLKKRYCSLSYLTIYGYYLSNNKIIPDDKQVTYVIYARFASNRKILEKQYLDNLRLLNEELYSITEI